jgi:hypothetical protein
MKETSSSKCVVELHLNRFREIFIKAYYFEVSPSLLTAGDATDDISAAITRLNPSISEIVNTLVQADMYDNVIVKTVCCTILKRRLNTNNEDIDYSELTKLINSGQLGIDYEIAVCLPYETVVGLLPKCMREYINICKEHNEYYIWEPIFAWCLRNADKEDESQVFLSLITKWSSTSKTQLTSFKDCKNVHVLRTIIRMVGTMPSPPTIKAKSLFELGEYDKFME